MSRAISGQGSAEDLRQGSASLGAKDLRGAQSSGLYVRAFDPATLGVVRHARILSVGRKFARLDFGLSGTRRVPFRDILSIVEQGS